MFSIREISLTSELPFLLMPLLWILSVNIIISDPKTFSVGVVEQSCSLSLHLTASLLRVTNDFHLQPRFYV